MKRQSYWLSDEEYKLVTKKTPIPTIDMVIVKVTKGLLEVLLLIRQTGYAAGSWCLIGGRQWIGETLEDTIQRQAKDLNVNVELISPFSANFPAWINDKLGQDRTKQSLTHIYPVKIKFGQVREEGEEYKGFQWFPIDKLPKLAFNQNFEIQKTIGQLKNFNKNFMQELK